MDAFGAVASGHDLVVIEDAAHGIRATVDGRPLGGIGHLGTLSFHETKNVSCGEGGALLVNEQRVGDGAEIIHEKGTDRQRFFRGRVDKYSWVDVGSSYVLSDLAAAYLWAQLEQTDAITSKRLAVWQAYHAELEDLELRGDLRRPVLPPGCVHNAHAYHVLVGDLSIRTALIDFLAGRGVNAVFHYVPLHASAAGLRYGRVAGDLPVTDSVGDRLVRLPLWAGMDDGDVAQVVAGVRAFYGT
jgi:dTDP-4-amino-4,6-dideoxygalactose transaminase